MITLRRTFFVLGAGVLALTLAFVGLFAAWLHGSNIPIASGQPYFRVSKINPVDSADKVSGAPTAPFFVLLVGNDYRPGLDGHRGDALHVLGVNPQRKAATMLDIPRDTCWNGDKINAANTNGPRASADAVGQLLGGVPISYVVDVDFAGFEALVNGVGGVDVHVKQEMSDPNSGAFFTPGVHHMDGRAALAFSRNRYDFPDADITRTNNQGSLILDAMRQLQTKMQDAPGEFKLLALLGRHAKLDGIGIKDLYHLGRTAFSLNPDQIQNITIPITNGGCLGLAGSAGPLFADFRDNGIVGG